MQLCVRARLARGPGSLTATPLRDCNVLIARVWCEKSRFLPWGLPSKTFIIAYNQAWKITNSFNQEPDAICLLYFFEVFFFCFCYYIFLVVALGLTTDILTFQNQLQIYTYNSSYIYKHYFYVALFPFLYFVVLFLFMSYICVCFMNQKIHCYSFYFIQF